MWRDVKVALDAVFGSPEARRRQRRHWAQAADWRHTVAVIQERWGDCWEPPDDAPVFVLSAGWRSGSTLLQRWLMTDPSLIVWGEPFARCNIVPTLLDQLRSLYESWPRERDRFDPEKSDLTDAWIANMYPSVPALLDAHVAFFRSAFAAPALSAGYRRWGIKEVRWGLDEARYLRLLFPDCRIVFLYRDMIQAYSSFRNYIASEYIRWPDGRVATPRAFARFWRQRRREFLDGADEVDARVLQLEDLLECGDQQRDVAAYLDLDPAPLDTLSRIAGRAGKRGPGERVHYVPVVERLLLRLVGSGRDV